MVAEMRVFNQQANHHHFTEQCYSHFIFRGMMCHSLFTQSLPFSIHSCTALTGKYYQQFCGEKLTPTFTCTFTLQKSML